jgi:hypothetical protein
MGILTNIQNRGTDLHIVISDILFFRIQEAASIIPNPGDLSMAGIKKYI